MPIHTIMQVQDLNHRVHPYYEWYLTGIIEMIAAQVRHGNRGLKIDSVKAGVEEIELNNLESAETGSHKYFHHQLVLVNNLRRTCFCVCVCVYIMWFLEQMESKQKPVHLNNSIVFSHLNSQRVFSLAYCGITWGSLFFPKPK